MNTASVIVLTFFVAAFAYSLLLTIKSIRARKVRCVIQIESSQTSRYIANAIIPRGALARLLK